MTIDIHCHFIPRSFLNRALNNPASGVRLLRDEGEHIDLTVGSRFFGLNPVFFDKDRQRERMQALGIERSIISLATPMVTYGETGSAAAEGARICNDGLADVVRQDPERFGAWAFLPMQDPQAAAAELTRCVRELGFVGGHIATNVNGRYPDHDCFAPVFEAAIDLDVPLFMHPVTPLGREHMTEYELTVVAGYLFDSTIAILKLICSGTLDRYPRLKLVCAHTGAFSLPMRARMQREVDTNADLSGRLTKPIEEYLRGLYFESVCFEPAMLQFAASVVPVDRIMLGSDGPFPLGESDPVGFVANAIADPGDRDKIFRQNAIRLFGQA
jgi:aminocarboxymuconate-semialdehyde decarboxylase